MTREMSSLEIFSLKHSFFYYFFNLPQSCTLTDLSGVICSSRGCRVMWTNCIWCTVIIQELCSAVFNNIMHTMRREQGQEYKCAAWNKCGRFIFGFVEWQYLSVINMTINWLRLCNVNQVSTLFLLFLCNGIAPLSIVLSVIWDAYHCRRINKHDAYCTAYSKGPGKSSSCEAAVNKAATEHNKQNKD